MSRIKFKKVQIYTFIFNKYKQQQSKLQGGEFLRQKTKNEKNGVSLQFIKTAAVLSPVAKRRREESPGNAEPPYFPTGRGAWRKPRATESATESQTAALRGGKGENAR